MNAHFRLLWQISVHHAFRGGAADEFEFVPAPSAKDSLAAMQAVLRQRGGRLQVIIATDELGAPLGDSPGRSLLFGLVPRQAAFALYTRAPALAAGQIPLYANSPDAPDSLAAPRGIPRGDPLLASSGLADATPWGLLQLTASNDHVSRGQAFQLNLEAREDTLRYYVVLTPADADDAASLRIEDTGAAGDGRAPIAFRRIESDAFGPTHLSPAQLGGGARRTVLFETLAPVPRRARGPRGLELHRHDEVLIGHLPQAGADRPDAQFVVHLK
ncbi:hypothetical protein [Zoogloea dura]|jgi:hypothetical protein|uniref:Uncharacterized protein n=1 Tax=Zoogloea dura TaxID=2728840 RepID=A0A848G161_9RHOO|nr:hypothetical protein [Zoogloea dura]NML25024.1 hypothetical protein [Zoogloea dura]